MDKDMIEYLLSIGAIEYVFTDDDGEDVYKFTKDAMDMVPDLYDEQIEEFNAMVFSLWDKGVIDVFFDEDGDPILGINEQTRKDSYLFNLDKEERLALKEILSYLDEEGSEG